MLVTSSQSSAQRPLGLSVEELFALDRQYRRIEQQQQQQQQQQHIAQLQAQTRLTSSNLNRIGSRSLDLVSPQSSSHPLTILPSLEIHGHGYTNRPQPSPSSIPNYSRSHSIDHMKYIAPPPPPPILKHTYPQRSTTNDIGHQNYQSKFRTYLPQPIMPVGNISSSSSGNSFVYAPPPPSINYTDNRGSCKLRRQQPIKRESSRRIVVRPVVQRRREPSLSSSCESLDERRSSFNHYLPVQSNISNQSVPFTPSASLMEDVINGLTEETNNLARNLSFNDSLSDDDEVNLYEMRIPIGKTYDTSDISVQLEGPKILIHCHTIEPTDKRGNYRKHELKTELFVPDIVDDETIVAYLTEDGQLIVEGKYHLWAWKEIKKKKRIEQEQLKNASSSINSKLTSTKDNGGGLEQDITSSKSYTSNNNSIINNKIEKLDNNRTVIHVGEPLSSEKYNHTKNIINRFNSLNKNDSLNISDGQYSFSNDIPPILIYYFRLPFETLTDAIRIQSDPQLNILKIFIEQKEKNVLEEQQQQNKIIVHSTSRLCRLPRDYTYDYNRLRVNFVNNNFIRIEIPTLN
ncbi:unnamed protein product [Rotaria sp. Silwood1]|nr:unnamed protein product [Rotaria sp. Silwood1]CAF1605081.1 unnamed protein product [Rotaria sp. Silwood1]CAF3686662.1 unnamed protein product [Rotaria sp. Silwood1]CAF3729580.1 unnamed protein product [Rotaria sp. Silwood1]CAF3850656.1 unnamed protein product [Rotaria sp. Silwood1]